MVGRNGSLEIAESFVLCAIFFRSIWCDLPFNVAAVYALLSPCLNIDYATYFVLVNLALAGCLFEAKVSVDFEPNSKQRYG
jgi:hypothetical protein